jgi:hypothetical protein
MHCGEDNIADVIVCARGRLHLVALEARNVRCPAEEQCF